MDTNIALVHMDRKALQGSGNLKFTAKPLGYFAIDDNLYKDSLTSNQHDVKDQ